MLGTIPMDPKLPVLITTKLDLKQEKKIGVGCWNIRRGLLIREQELKDIIKTGSLNEMIQVVLEWIYFSST